MINQCDISYFRKHRSTTECVTIIGFIFDNVRLLYTVILLLLYHYLYRIVNNNYMIYVMNKIETYANH